MTTPSPSVHPATEAAQLIAAKYASEGKRIRIVAYGSLVNPEAAAETRGVDPSEVSVTPVTIKGLQRSWSVKISAQQQPPPGRPARVYVHEDGPNAGKIFDGDFAMMGVQINPEATMLAGLIDIEPDELARFGSREQNYYLDDVTHRFASDPNVDVENEVVLIFMPQHLSRELYTSPSMKHPFAADVPGAIPVRQGYEDNMEKAFSKFEGVDQPWQTFVADTRPPKFDRANIAMKPLTPELVEELSQNEPERREALEKLLTPEGQLEATKFGAERTYELDAYLRGPFRELFEQKIGMDYDRYRNAMFLANTMTKELGDGRSADAADYGLV